MSNNQNRTNEIASTRNVDQLARTISVLQRQSQVLKSISLDTSDSITSLSIYLTVIRKDINRFSEILHALNNLTVNQISMSARIPLKVNEGYGMEFSSLRLVRKMIANGEHTQARSLALLLIKYKETKRAGLLCSAVISEKKGLHDLMGSYIEKLSENECLENIPYEWVQWKFHSDPISAYRFFIETPIDKFSLFIIGVVIKNCIDHEMTKEAFDLVAKLREKFDGDTFSPKEAEQFEDIFRYLEHRFDSQSQIEFIDSDRVRIGIWDNVHPKGKCSEEDAYIGLYTALSISCLMRFGVKLNSQIKEIIQVLINLQNRSSFTNKNVPPFEAEVVPVARYNHNELDVPVPTWIIYHGDFCHQKLYKYGSFPISKNIRPIFLGFKLCEFEIIENNVILFLKRFAPVGCADWSTVYLLLCMGIPAFFSGPFLSGLEEDGRSGLDGGHKEGSLRSFQQEFLDSMTSKRYSSSLLDVVSNVEFGRLLNKFESHAHDLSSSVLGEKNGASNNLFNSTTISKYEIFSATMQSILEGKTEGEIYSLWRTLTLSLVNQAREKFLEIERPILSDFNILSDVQSHKRIFMRNVNPVINDNTVHIAMACDKRMFGQLVVAIQSIADSTERTLVFHLLVRELSNEDISCISNLFPHFEFEFIFCDSIDYGPTLKLSKYLTVSAMDRLVLPLMLPDLNQIAYIDVDVLVKYDIGKLFDQSMGSHAIAACTATADWSQSGFKHLFSAAKRLPAKRRFELRHELLRRHHFDFKAYNSGVMVLNLRKMREDRFCESYIPYLSYFDFSDQELLYFYTGGSRVVLEREWNSIPSHEYIIEPKIIHWAGPVKPWSSSYIPYRNAWHETLDRLLLRVKMSDHNYDSLLDVLDGFIKSR